MDYFDCLKIRTLFNSEISEFQNNCSCKINFNAELVELEFGFLVKTENEDHHYSFTVYISYINLTNYYLLVCINYR